MTENEQPAPTPNELERIRDILFGARARKIEDSMTDATARLHEEIVGLRADLASMRAAVDGRIDEQAERAVDRREMAQLLREWATRLDGSND